MAWKKKEEEDLDWSKLLKGLADLIRLLIYAAIGIWWLIEFVFNPYNNVSTFFLVEHTYGMAVQCQGEYTRWEVRVDTIEKSGSNYKAILTRRQVDLEGHRSDDEIIEIFDRNDLTFPCSDETVVAGLVWSIDEEEGVHFRAPRPFEIWEVER